MRPLSERGNRAVEIWLWLTAALVFCMVVVGGATRLTGSGLSITEWKPIMGAVPPASEAAWLDAFEKYKQIPQYKLVNEGMSLEAFKGIFWWEWSHRFLARAVGAVFALPLLFFWWRGTLRRGSAAKLAGVLALGALQGGVGWFMVYSGLAERVSVSHYRLALHLSIAFALLSLLVWLALDERRARLGEAPGAASRGARRRALMIVALVGLQVALGAFVAGLKAGLVYNTWPMMDGQWFPSDYFSPGLGWLSLFESHAAVQFNHRLAAYAVLALVALQVVAILRGGASGPSRASALLLLGAALAQAALGVVTLLRHVPLPLGLLHQGGAAVVMALAAWHLFEARRPAPAD